MIWLFAVITIFFMLHDARVRRITKLQESASLLIGIVVFGNMGLLAYLIVRIFDLAKTTSELGDPSNLIVYIIYLAVFGFCEIVILLIILPDARRCKRLLRLREDLLKSLVNNAILYK